MNSNIETTMTALSGRIRDIDTHEMFPARMWVDEFGPCTEPIASLFMRQSPDMANSFSPIDDDNGPITAETVASSWSKACRAVGAYDMERRLEMMNVAGIDEALVFGSALMIAGQEFAAGSAGLAAMQFGGAEADLDLRALGLNMLEAHNQWCLRAASKSDRLRPVGMVLTETLAGALKESERLIDGGLRALSYPTGLPIEGKAPCHPDNDVLWRLLADKNIPVLLHLGGEKPFLKQPEAWINCPQFRSNDSLPSEVNVDPFSMTTCNLAAQNLVTNMVLGGVFERVPDLRCGVIELGANWVGPVGQNMDLWVEQFARRFSGQLSMKPSDYIRRNIRVTPFHFEPVDLYFAQYDFLKDVLCFSSDYPHYEGGKDPVSDMIKRLQPLGAEILEKYFVTNAELVMPGSSSPRAPTV